MFKANLISLVITFIYILGGIVGAFISPYNNPINAVIVIIVKVAIVFPTIRMILKILFAEIDEIQNKSN